MLAPFTPTAPKERFGVLVQFPEPAPIAPSPFRGGADGAVEHSQKITMSKKVQIATPNASGPDLQKFASEGETVTVKIIRLVATNDRGMRIGQYHQRAKYPDEMVDKARDLHEDKGLGYVRIARILGVPKSVVRDWCRYSRRAQSYVSWKKVKG